MSISQIISKLVGIEADNIPNIFTIGMGNLVKTARIEAGLSQAELGEMAYFRQASISEIENGKREISSGELIYFSSALSKPIAYFFPEPYKKFVEANEGEDLLKEMLLVAKKLTDDDIKRLIVQIKAIADMHISD